MLLVFHAERLVRFEVSFLAKSEEERLKITASKAQFRCGCDLPCYVMLCYVLFRLSKIEYVTTHRFNPR